MPLIKKFRILKFKSKPILLAKGISKTISNRVILRKIDFEINKGEIFGLLGPNGAGKSVTFNVLLGIMKANQGNVYAEGTRITDFPIHERAKRFKMGYIPQNDSVFKNLSCEDNLRAIAEIAIKDKNMQESVVQRLLSEFNLSHLRNVKANNLSGGERKKTVIARALVNNPKIYAVEKETLFFALAEFPYITYLNEIYRQEIKPDKEVVIDGIKEILIQARKIFTQKHRLRYHNLTSQTFQTYLQYARNLTLIENRLTPDLYTLITIAKQISGDPFAIAVLEAAREYPFQVLESTSIEPLALGIDKAVDSDNTPMNMKNRLSENQIEWRGINLKPEPNIKKQAQWKYNWNPYGQCSWPPEDDQIESFNTHVREQSKLLLSNDLARSEKFIYSIKDGVDMRDTLRHWHEGDIYVKEIPASRGRIEIVVFIFDIEPNPNNYQWCQTWYAEHNKESTLCFFATDYMNDMVGPGVGRATYGGCMMIYPPRPIPDIWKDPRIHMGKTLEEKLLEAAFFHSQEKYITVVTPCLPKSNWRKISRKYHKSIIHIPLKRFSNQTIEKVRRFHVLNGKQIRSFAKHFIQDL